MGSSRARRDALPDPRPEPERTTPSDGSAQAARPTEPGSGSGAGRDGRRDADRPRPAAGDGHPAGGSREAQITSAARTWQRRLADLGGRNTLLWYQDLPSGILDLTNAHPGGVSMLMAGRGTRLSDLVREPSAFREARRRAHVVRDKIRELDEERGLVAGFMAIGMATWDVPGARRAPQAPVLLRSCVLQPTDPAHRDYDIDLDDRLELNPVLVHYLASEQGIGLDPDAITEIAYIAKRFDPMPAFRELTRLCRSVPGFRIADRRIIGTFSYAKLPMVADLAAVADALYRNDVVAALADPTPARPGTASPAQPARIGSDPGDGLAAFDLDADQQAVLDAVRSGSDAVVTAAPGTGRTQTVAALAAALAADGKRVLVLAQKRAALTDLHARLGRAGLGDLVLDLHDGPLDRGRVARLVRASIDGPRRAAEPDVHDVEASLHAYRDRLERHRGAMHETRAPWGVTVADAHDALSRLSRGRRAPTSRVRLTGDVLARLDAQGRGHAAALLTEAAGHGAWTEERGKDPWARARVTTEADRRRSADLVADLSGARFERDRDRLDALLRSAGMPPAPTPARWGEVLDLVGGVRETLDTFDADVYGPRLTDYVGATASRAVRAERGVRMWWWTRWSLRREARTHLREGARPDDLHAALVAASEQRAEWARLSGGASTPRVPAGTDEARRTYDSLDADLAWLDERLATTSGGGDLRRAAVDAVAARLQALTSRRDRLDVLPAVTPILDELDRLGLTPLVDDLTARRLPAENVRAETEFVWWCSVLEAVAAADPRIGEHDGAELRTVLEEYVRLDRDFVRAGADRVLARVADRLDDVVDRRGDAVSLLRSEAARTGRHLPMLDLVEKTSEVLTAARPVWTMSPLVVASVVPPGAHFDVVVLDEASGVEPAQFVSAAARAAQVVLVGDDRALPPSPFLTAAADAEQAELDDGVSGPATASVLDALAGRLPRFTLRTQYRDRDERIGGFVAAHLHGGAVESFPAAGRTSPVTLETVRVGDGDGTDLEAAEAARVVELVLEHARTRPTQSLGVVTLDAGHAARIVAALRTALDAERSPSVFAFFDDDGDEPFFVKPLDRVQGDSRAAIVLAVGVAPDEEGRVVHRLGPLHLDGGARRLGVGISAARERLTVCSALTPSDLADRHLSALGVRLLHDLLEYAAHRGDPAVLRRQVAAPTRPAAGGPGQAVDASAAETPGPAAEDERHELLTELAVRLRQEGLVVHEGYGLSGRRIDLAVEDPYTPGRVVVAVESDGRRYAAIGRARDRDRLRAEQLARLGWQHVRVWGLDVFADPARDVARILDAVRSAERDRRP